MLQTDRAEWSGRMGLESSKPPPPVGVPTAGQQTGVPNSPPLPHYENPTDQSAATHESNGIPNSSISLKRSRTPPREPYTRAPMSPPNLRQAFIPDRGDHWSPSRDHRLDKGSLSPDATRRRDRGDRWVPPTRRSPPQRKSSPPRRLSPVRSGSSEHVEWSRPLPKSSPARPSRPSIDQHDSDAREVATFKNLTWKAPEMDSRQLTDAIKSKSQNVSVDGAPTLPEQLVGRRVGGTTHVKVDFNGLKGVPTGPKQAPALPSSERSKLPSRMLPPVDISVRRSPHIFISTEFLPAQGSMARHLHRFLRRYIPRELDVCVDESGWYLCFEDTDAGRERLELCYKSHNGAKLFSMYTMHMEPFPDGQPSPTLKLHTSVNGVSSFSNVNLPGGQPSAEAVTNAQSFLDNLDMSLQTDTLAEDKASTDRGIEIPSVESNVNGIITSSLPGEVAFHHLRNSSPLRVPSRQDKDETSSSISGITGSDMSVSKRLKCHVCQINTHLDTDALVHCSSCPRRYHRRCHLQPAIPPDLDQDHSWQCRRCIKKQVQPKSRLSNASPAADFSPAASVGQPEAPPPKRLRLDVSQPSALLNSTVIVNGLNVVSNNGTKDVSVYHQPEQNEDVWDAEDDYEPAERPTLNSDEKHLSEANDLVAKSFASPEVQTESPAKSALKSGKLNLVRKKIARTEQVSAPESVDPPGPMTRSPKSAAQPAAEQSESDTSTHPLGLDNAEPKRYRKPHKWAGGGADKDIIEAGKEYFLPGCPSPLVDNIAAPFNVPKAQPTIESVATTEVPESPEEARRWNLDGHVSTKDKAPTEQPKRHTHNGTRKLTPSTAKAPGPQKSLSHHPAVAAQRTKPGSPQVAQCVKCQKKIAYHPSGTNNLCSRCKVEASVDSTPRSAKSVSKKAEDKVQNRTNATEDAAEPIEEEDRPETVSPKQTFYAPKIGNQREESDRSPATSFKPTRPRTSCEKCRKNRRRCTHNSPNASRVQGSSRASGTAAIVDKQIEDDGSEGDLDFWTAKSAPQPANGEINQKALSPDRPIENGAETAASMDGLPDNEGSRSHSPFLPLGKDAPVSPQAKRQSQTRPATGAHDLGDSFSRPPNTYVKLIGMALCSAPRHRLKGNDIVQWVIKNIPSYKAGEGKWENSLRATMTLKRAGYGGNEGLWRIVDDGSKKNQGFMYELLPGQAENMLHWDPVLGQPVSPPKGWRIEQKEHASHSKAGAGRPHSPSDESPETPVKPPRARRRRRQERGDKRRSASSRQDRTQLDSPAESLQVEIENGRPMEDLGDSSDDEPLARMRRQPSGPPTAALRRSGVDSAEGGIDDVMDIDQLPDANGLAKTQPLISPIKREIAGKRSAVLPKPSRPTLAELIEMDAKNVDYSAKSLFDEWPEYDPKNEFDRVAKIAEIKRRPTRKQRFGKQDSRVEMERRGPVSRYVFSENSLSSERPKRMNRSAPYPWEAGEENVIQCDTVAELFNLPSNPIAIIHNGELAYRDSFKNTRVVYKTGHA